MYNFDFFNTFDFNIANIYNDKIHDTYLVYFDEDLVLHIKPIGSEMYKNIIIVYLGDKECAETKYNILKSAVIRLSDIGTGEEARDISLTEFKSTMYTNRIGRLLLKSELRKRYTVEGVSNLINTPELIFMNLYELSNLNKTIIKCVELNQKTKYVLMKNNGYQIVELFGNFFKAYKDFLRLEKKIDIPDILFENTLNLYLPAINLNDLTIDSGYILDYSIERGLYFKDIEKSEGYCDIQGVTDLFSF